MVFTSVIVLANVDTVDRSNASANHDVFDRRDVGVVHGFGVWLSKHRVFFALVRHGCFIAAYYLGSIVLAPMGTSPTSIVCKGMGTGNGVDFPGHGSIVGQCSGVLAAPTMVVQQHWLCRFTRVFVFVWIATHSNGSTVHIVVRFWHAIVVLPAFIAHHSGYITVGAATARQNIDQRRRQQCGHLFVSPPCIVQRRDIGAGEHKFRSHYKGTEGTGCCSRPWRTALPRRGEFCVGVIVGSNGVLSAWFGLLAVLLLDVFETADCSGYNGTTNEVECGEGRRKERAGRGGGRRWWSCSSQQQQDSFC